MASETLVGQSRFSDGNSELNRTEFIVRQMMNKMATVTLVQVKAVGNGTVDVQPMVAQIDGSGKGIPHGTIGNVPVFTLRAGASAIVMTPVVGDIGACIFCHNDVSTVKKTRKPSNPGSRRRFDWADALYLGGFLGAEPTQFIRFDDDGITMQAAAGKTVTSSGPLVVTGEAQVDDLSVGGHKVVGVQQPALPSNATDIASALALVNAMKVGLRAHGLFA